jgi:hypothetical protein
MSIPISSIVSVTPRLISAGQTGLELNGLFLTKSNRIPSGAGRVLEFTDVKAAGDYFGLESTEYALASVYFAGYDNSYRKPARVYFALYITTALPSWLRGGSPAALSVLQAVTSGTLTLNIGSNTETVTLNLSSATSYSAAAALIQTSIRGKSNPAWQNATVSYSSDFKAFIITSGTAGAAVGIDYASGTLASNLGLSESAGALLSQGADAETPAANMESITAITDNFVSFTVTEAVTDAESLALAEWSNDKGIRYLYVIWNNSATLTISGNTSNIGSQLQERDYAAVTAIYGDAKYAAFLLSFPACIDFTRTRGTATAAFKGSSLLTVNVTNSATANALREKGFNYYGRYAENNTQFIFLYPGILYGAYNWIDTYINAIWLNASIQQAEMTLLTNNTRLPYNEIGYTSVKAAMMDVIVNAVRSGVIDTGVVISQVQAAKVNQEAGKEISDNLYTDGYYVQVSDPGAEARASRQTPEISLWYTYGGAIQRMNILSTLVE